MTEEEFYAKIDRSIASAKEGHVIRMRDNESTDQFVDRLLGIDSLKASVPSER